VQRYFGTAVGKGRQAAKNEIEKLVKADAAGSLSCRDAVKHLARIVYSTHDEKDKAFECELSWICDESGGEFRRVPKELAEEAITLAKAALEDDDMADA
jgi:20S proteasome subunit alpha 7